MTCALTFPPFCTLLGQKAVAPRFRLLDRDGIANVGDYVLPGDVYINMQVCGQHIPSSYSPSNSYICIQRQRPTNTRDPVLGTNLPDNFYRPTPMSWKHAPAMAGEKCIIDKVMLTGQ